MIHNEYFSNTQLQSDRVGEVLCIEKLKHKATCAQVFQCNNSKLFIETMCQAHNAQSLYTYHLI